MHPGKAAAKIASSPALRYVHDVEVAPRRRWNIRSDTQARVPSSADSRYGGAACQPRPSIPSVKLAPFEKAVTIKTTKGMNTNHEYGSELGIQSIKSA